jgi:hypothetical protein
MKYLVLPGIVVFVVLATAIWGMIVDGTVRRPPSEWIASLYLGVFVGGMISLGFFVDKIFAHPLATGAIGIVLVISVVLFTVVFWRTVRMWDEKFRSSKRPRR